LIRLYSEKTVLYFKLVHVCRYEVVKDAVEIFGTREWNDFIRRRYGIIRLGLYKLTNPVGPYLECARFRPTLEPTK
jgi:hypothetical protein